VRVGEGGTLFKVVEVWVENKQLLEFLPPDFVQAYLNLFADPQSFEAAVNAMQQSVDR